jgi:hypothetical protein
MFGGMNGRGSIKMDVWKGMGTGINGLGCNLEKLCFINSMIILK